MNMSLTNDDLRAVKNLIDGSIDERVLPMFGKLESRLTKRIDDLDDSLSMQMENGLQEVRDQISSVKETVERIERVQLVEIDRNNQQDQTIAKMRRALQAV